MDAAPALQAPKAPGTSGAFADHAAWRRVLDDESHAKYGKNFRRKADAIVEKQGGWCVVPRSKWAGDQLDTIADGDSSRRTIRVPWTDDGYESVNQKDQKPSRMDGIEQSQQHSPKWQRRGMAGGEYRGSGADPGSGHLKSFGAVLGMHPDEAIWRYFYTNGYVAGRLAHLDFEPVIPAGPPTYTAAEWQVLKSRPEVLVHGFPSVAQLVCGNKNCYCQVKPEPIIDKAVMSEDELNAEEKALMAEYRESTNLIGLEPAAVERGPLRSPIQDMEHADDDDGAASVGASPGAEDEFDGGEEDHDAYEPPLVIPPLFANEDKDAYEPRMVIAPSIFSGEGEDAYEPPLTITAF